MVLFILFFISLDPTGVIKYQASGSDHTVAEGGGGGGDRPQWDVSQDTGDCQWAIGCFPRSSKSDDNHSSQKVWRTSEGDKENKCLASLGQREGERESV